MDKLTNHLRIFLHTTIFPYLLFAKIWGSRSHNIDLPDSDWDYLVIYQTPTEQILSLDGYKDTLEGADPDFQAHEIGKFCQLLLKGNPGIIECLFTDRGYYKTKEFKELEEHRREFLSKKVVEQYIGYAKGQLYRLGLEKSLHTVRGKYNTKWAYHMARILLDAQRIAKGEEPLIWKDGAERDFLMRIRAEEFSKEEIVQLCNTLVSEIDKLKPWPIPDEGNKKFLNEWLLDLRLANYEKI